MTGRTLPRRIHRTTCAVVLGLLIVCSPGRSQIHSLRTHDLQIFFLDPAHDYLVPHLARCFENTIDFHHRLFHYYPADGVTILLQDFNDYGHGGTSAMPWNSVDIGLEPFDCVYETQPANERMNWLMNHELVHLLTTDQSSSSDRFFRTLFSGKVTPAADNPMSMVYSYLTNPRWYSPRWYHEGLAVFLETWLSGGMGRVLGGYDEMVFRAMVLDSSYFYDVVGLESEGTAVDFQVGQNAYLYGTRFVTYLAARYGIEKLNRWFNRIDGSDRYFSSQFEEVYGVPLEEEWQRWIQFEHKWQQSNLDSIRAFPVTSSRPLLPEALGSVSRAYFSPGERRIYTAVNYPGEVAHIVSIGIDRGDVRTICDVPTPALYYVTSLTYDPASETIFFTTDNSRNWRDIQAVDTRTGNVQMLLKDCRIGDLAFNSADRSLWGVQHHEGRSIIVRIPPPYQGWNTVLKLDYGKDAVNLDVSPDGRMLTATSIDVSGRERLVAWSTDSLLLGNPEPRVLFEFENNAAESFVFTADRRYLFGTSYYTGVSNVWRYDLQSAKMEIVSNVETGYFRPVPVFNDSLVVFRYGGKGFLPVLIAVQPREDVNAIRLLGQHVVETQPIVTTWALPSPMRINLDSITVSHDDYEPLANIRLASLYPIIDGYKVHMGMGLKASLMDPLGLHNIDISVSYSPGPRRASAERFHALLDYAHYPWKITTAYNRADFYDLFGPTKTSRKGYSLAVQYGDYVINERPLSLEYKIRTAGYWGLERLPEFQNVATSFDRFYTVNAGMTYSRLLRTLGAVEFEKGVSAGVVSANTVVRSILYPRMHGTVDYGILLPLLHSSVWLRGAAGVSFGDRNEPFANFYFGGFGNNWVDHQEARRYREYSSFPGIDLNAAGGANFGKGMVEWVLPPLRFRHFGAPGLYVNWTQLNLFAGGLVTNADSAPDRQVVGDLGAQLDMKLVIFSLLESTFSLGAAVASQYGGRPSTELMVSLKILR